MTIQIILLALASAVRPSSFVAVYALVRQRSPSRLMAAYVVAGLAFTVAVGLAVVWVFRGIELNAGTDRTKAIAEIVAGALALGLGAAVALRVGPMGRGVDSSAAEGRWGRARGHHLTTRTAALAGPVTHIPGLLYVLALDLIVSQEPGVAGELIEVGVYNLLWFALPIVMLAICIVDPPAARRVVQRLEQWGRAHARTIVLTISFGLGGWLLIEGATTV